MTFIIRRSDLTIKTYAERGDDFILDPGETIEEITQSFISYAKRLVISCNGKSGETVFVPALGFCIIVDILCPDEQSVELNINGLPVKVELIDSRGIISISTAEPGLIQIEPADRTKYCPAGQSALTIEVTP